MKWNPITETPPDELVEVMDDHGCIGRAYPTIYPFKIERGKSGRKSDYKIIQCDPYWDGGWLIECEGLESKIIGRIVKWRNIQ